MKLSKCTSEELTRLRSAVSQPGSKVRHIILNVEQDEDEGATVFVCANAIEKMSAAMWAKQLGVARLQQEVVQCTDGVDPAMAECSTRHKLNQGSEERYGSPSQRQAHATAAVAQNKSKSTITKKRKESDSEASDGEDNAGGPVRMTCDVLKPTPSSEAPRQPQVETRALSEILVTHQFPAFIGRVAPVLAWERFNKLAAFWYVRTGRDYGNEQHMPTVFQAMYDHPQRESGWQAFVSEKQAELETDTHYAGVDQELLRFLLGKRVDSKMLWKVEEVWGMFAAWAEEYDAGSERDTLYTRIQAMGTHVQSDIDWRRHAVKKNRYYHDPAMMCQ
jgi:hypothetical protein